MPLDLSGQESNVNPAFNNLILQSMLQQLNLGQPTFGGIEQANLPIPLSTLQTPTQALQASAPDPNAASLVNEFGTGGATASVAPPLGSGTVGPAGDALSGIAGGASTTPTPPLASGAAAGGGPSSGSTGAGSVGTTTAVSPGSAVLSGMLAQLQAQGTGSLGGNTQEVGGGTSGGNIGSGFGGNQPGADAITSGNQDIAGGGYGGDVGTDEENDSGDSGILT